MKVLKRKEIIICGDMIILPAGGNIKPVFTYVTTRRRLHSG